MFAVISKYLKPKHPLQAKWFAQKAIRVIYEDLKTNPSSIKNIRAYYNHEIQNCILKFEFDQKLTFDDENTFLYMLLNYQTEKMEHYGYKFENHISDNTLSISWIHHNKILVFYPDNETMALLPTALHKKTPESFL